LGTWNMSRCISYREQGKIPPVRWPYTNLDFPNKTNPLYGAAHHPLYKKSL
jgi:hypothetical protein